MGKKIPKSPDFNHKAHEVADHSAYSLVGHEHAAVGFVGGVFQRGSGDPSVVGTSFQASTTWQMVPGFTSYAPGGLVSPDIPNAAFEVAESGLYVISWKTVMSYKQYGSQANADADTGAVARTSDMGFHSSISLSSAHSLTSNLGMQEELRTAAYIEAGIVVNFSGTTVPTPIQPADSIYWNLAAYAITNTTTWKRLVVNAGNSTHIGIYRVGDLPASYS